MFSSLSEANPLKKLRNPWITAGLMNSINEDHRKYKLYRNGNISFDQYKNYRNKLNMLIRLHKINLTIIKIT